MAKPVKSYAPALLSLSFGVLAAGVLWFYVYALGIQSKLLESESLLRSVIADFPAAERALLTHGLEGQLAFFGWFSLILFFVFAVASLVSLLRIRLSLMFMRGAIYLGYLGGAWYVYTVCDFTSKLYEMQIKLLSIDISKLVLFELRRDFAWHACVGLVFLLFWHIFTLRSHVRFVYTGQQTDERAIGDLIFEDIRTHGHHPRYRKSLYSSAFLHVFIIFLLPWLLTWFGCVEAYKIPKGSGNPVVDLVKMVKPKKKPKKKLVSNPNSAILFEQPDLEDSDIMREVEEETQLTHVADANRVHGKPGQGGGKKGGWPDGMDDAVVRFIRIEYNGSRWDDGMGQANGNADANFLREFAKITGFKTRRLGESHRAALLAKYPKGGAPPFVFMTGDGSININRSEMKIMRDYIMDGGCLFIDAGSRQFDRAVRSFLSALMPDQRLLRIADDDPLFQQPFVMDSGMPGSAAHGGDQAMGIKIRGRWAVIYSPVDINDAWKDGASGLSRDRAQRCYHMGVNIIYYTFTKYLQETRKYRK